ncbi:MAG TPA: hypothetical protein VFG69_16580 [Nannocystaceae bacterium]|nr:hypothetical protein [Nannocystaceae bacterium]
MADDATVPPSPARVRRAWAAGRRPGSMWLPVGLALCGIAAAIAWWRPASAPRTAALRGALAQGGDGAIEIATSAIAAASFGALVIAGIVVGALFVAALVQGRLGPIGPELEADLGAPPVRAPLWLGLLLAAALLAAVASDVAALVVGGARAADASASALFALWRLAAVRLLGALGLAACAIGLAESWWSRRAQIAALAMTDAQARSEARRGRRR